jgi:diacylglycerol kinase family enzyme
VRGLLVVNPRATTTSPRVIDVIVHALSDELDLDVTVTTHKGHGISLGEMAVQQQLDIVITLGGDGIINEVVNGILSGGLGSKRPMLATVPGGSANVVARTLGLPTDAVEATGQLLDLLRAGSTRTIGLGKAGDRYFVANAGLGIDAEIISSMERQRRSGRSATPARYLRTAVLEFFRSANRKEATLTLTRPASPEHPTGERVDGVHLAIIQNTSPWTFFGNWPISTCPDASFDLGLDVFAMRRMGLPTALLATERLLRSKSGGGARGGLVLWHDQTEFRIEATRPVEFQIDGEGLGSAMDITFTSHPNALRVVA